MKLALVGTLCWLFLPFTLNAEEGEKGYASYYAGKFQGRLTANGEIFDTRRFTAAHPTLPFNTIVRVTHLETGASTLVRINDRGPFIEGRIIDLSRAAAGAIGMLAGGVARVSVEVVEEGDGGTYHRDGYRRESVLIQVGAFGEIENARRLKQELEEEGFEPGFEPTGGTITRVVIPNVPREDVLLTKARLRALGHFDVIVRSE